MKFSRLFLLFMMVFAITISCDDEPLGPTRDVEEEVVDPTPDPDPDPIPEPSGIDISETFGNDTQRSFLGHVVDVNENPISNVDIRIGNSTALTDNNGIFIIDNATVKKNFGYITASKAGYVEGSRTVVPTTGTNKVTIMLLEENIIGTTSSGAQTTINLPNGASVSLNGDYIKEDGSTYQGNVDVILHHLNPSDPNMEVQMPGMLFAANTDNEARALRTFGMLKVELRGSSGEKLNLAQNTTAQIEVPIPAELMADAPSTIPLWYFDEEAGYWIEDGEAQLSGNKYIGNVSHFTFWNYDIDITPIRLCITAVDENNNFLANHIIRFTSPSLGIRTGITNTSGQVCGYFPIGETIQIEVLNYAICGNEVIHTETVGPFTSSTDITVIVPNNPSLIAETVTGRFNDCDGNPVSDGYVILSYGQEQFVDEVSNGTFEINFFRCEAETTFTIEAYDYNSQQTTGLINYSFTTPTTNLGTIAACDAFTEFITYQLGDNPPVTYYENVGRTVYSDFPDYSHYRGYSNTFTFPGPTDTTFELYSEFYEVGSYNVNGIDIAFKIRDESTNYEELSIELDYTIRFNIVQFGEVGEYIDINFSGGYGGLNPVFQTPISGTIHIIRDY